MKRSFFQDGCVDTDIWMHHMDAYEAAGEEAGRKLHKNVESSIKQVLATTPHETPTIRTLAPHHENYTSSTNQTCRTLLEKQGRIIQQGLTCNKTNQINLCVCIIQTAQLCACLYLNVTIYPTRPVPTISTSYISSWPFNRPAIPPISDRGQFTCFTNIQQI